MREKVIPKILCFPINEVIQKKKLTTCESKSAFPRMRASNQWLSEGKNYAISKARVLVDMFLIYPIWINYVSTMPTSIVDLNLEPPSWFW